MNFSASQLQLLLLIVVSIGVGWYLGRFQYRTRSKGKAIKPSGGLNKSRSPLRLLMDSYSDTAVDELLSGLEVSAKTLPIHLSIGRHFRQEGEVDRAILIHQNLLAHPQLSSANAHAVTYELARDYKAAGLYDRAESLLEELVFSRDLSDQARRLLLSILERQKDWGQAVELISKWDCRRDPDLAKRMAHYHCEMAVSELDSGRYSLANRHLGYASKVDLKNPRVLLLLAQLKYAEGESAQAIGCLRSLIEDHSGFAPLAMDLLVKCSEITDTKPKMRDFLEARYYESSNENVLLVLVNQLIEAGKKGDARALLEAHIDRAPSPAALSLYAELFVEPIHSEVEILRMTKAVRDAKGQLTHYQCADCGFDAGFHWQCPSCFHWESIKPVATS